MFKDAVITVIKFCIQERITEITEMLWIVLLTVLGLLAWYKFIKPLKHFSKMGLQQTKPLPLFGDQFKMVFRQQSFLEVIQMIYNKFPEAR